MSNNLLYSKDGGLKQAPDKSGYSDGLSQIKDGVATIGQSAQDDALQLAATAKDTAKSKMDEARTYTDGYSATIKKQLAEKPLQTIAIAFTAGLVLSALFGRR